MRAWGQAFVVTRGGGCVVGRRNNEVVFIQDGDQPVSVQLKEEELKQNEETAISLSFESNSSTPSHVIKGVTVRGEMLPPTP